MNFGAFNVGSACSKMCITATNMSKIKENYEYGTSKNDEVTMISVTLDDIQLLHTYCTQYDRQLASLHYFARGDILPI